MKLPNVLNRRKISDRYNSFESGHGPEYYADIEFNK